MAGATSVGSLFTVVGGGTPSTANPEFWNGSIPWATSADLGDDLSITPRKSISPSAIKASATNLVPAGSIVVATRVGLGKVGIAHTDMCFSQDCQALVLDSRTVDSRFAALQMKIRVQEFKHTSRGTTIAGVTKKQLLDVGFFLRSIEQQRRIVAEIDKQFTQLEAGAAAFRRVERNLKRYRAAVLKAGSEGRLIIAEIEHPETGNNPPQGESGEALLARIVAERRSSWRGRGRYKEPESARTIQLPQLPTNWTWVSPDQVAASEDNAICAGPFGTIFKARDFRRSGVPIIFLRHVAPGRYLKHKPGFMDEGKWDELFRPYSVFGGELLITKLGEPPGVCTIYPVGIGPAMVTPDVIKFTVNSAVAMPRYLMHYFNSENARRFSLGAAFGTTRLRLTIPIFRRMPVPLPPLAEQAQIVAEIERRLSVVDEIETMVSANLQRGVRLRLSILHKAFASEFVAQEFISHPTAIEPSKVKPHRRPNAHFARTLLSAEIVHRLHSEPTFGRVKHQKVFHLCEHIAQIEELQGQYHREAAGPLDNKLLYSNEAELRKQRWYQEVDREFRGHAYEPLANAGQHRRYLERYWPDKLLIVEKLIELMRTWKTEQCEIFSTTYAAWNDLIIWGQQPTDGAILHEILERWHSNKRRFTEARWRKAITWMKRNGFAPTGFGRPTALRERP